ncbi:MAG: response regulator [Crocinitomicaceae bacterium]|nr:response regulator [Crocinitomicaceae bacterium]
MTKKLNCILLIDDNNFTNIFNRRFLSKIDAADHIHAVKDGREALEYLHHQGDYHTNNGKFPKPDMIFLDINMPIMDGWEFLKEFNNIKHHFEDTVIVMLTTSPNPDDQKKAQEIMDVHGFYRKPLTRKMVEEIIQKHFNG